MPALAVVLDAIARAVLGERDDADVRLGTVTLRPHQCDALRRVRTAIAEFGGVLLADEPGLGKTYVALALVREYPSAIVAAPAALREMWRQAAARATVRVTFVSLEALSRGEVRACSPLVIVDEAHHACNPRARRYGRLARLSAGAHVLLLSATPVRNRRAELDALLGLFLGPRATVLDEPARSRCIIRRTGEALALPEIDGPHWHAAPRIPDVARAIADALACLPPPLPALDGREARALLAMTLARCWASSLAALDAALRRRLQRGAALDAVLEAGRIPTRAELRAWVVGDDAVQLAFPLLVSRTEGDTARMRGVLQAHVDAVRALRVRIAPQVRRDAEARAAVLLGLRATHGRERIIAFSSHAETVEALYRALRRIPGVALLTGRGARTASGARARDDVLRALEPGAPSRRRAAIDDISLVLTTDVLSEGVNLQGASVVVHLDVPWTPAALEQRVGRAARLGSAHTRVHVHGIAAPAAAERMLTLERRLARKHGERVAAARSSMDAEQLRRKVAPWRATGPAHDGSALVAAVHASLSGFLATVMLGDAAHLVGGVRRGAAYTVTEEPHVLAALTGAVGGEALAPDARTIDHARAALRRWMKHHRARTAIASGHPASSARRSLLERFDGVLASTPAFRRAIVARRVAAVRARVESSAGAGAEQALASLVRLPCHDAAAWLDECERKLGAASTGVQRRVGTVAEPIRALLLLVRSRPAP